MNKRCIQCLQEKSINEFYIRRDTKIPRPQSLCKVCQKNYRLNYVNKNKNDIKAKRLAKKEKIHQYGKQYYKTHKDQIAVKAKIYNLKNKEDIRKVRRTYYLANRSKLGANALIYESNRRAQDPQFKLTKYLRSRIFNALKDNTKIGSVISNLGCSITELKLHIESKFQPGMTWGNWSTSGWHLDHIKPLSSFDLTNPEEFTKASHFTNLQPLWAKDNLRKSNKYEIGQEK